MLMCGETWSLTYVSGYDFCLMQNPVSEGPRFHDHTTWILIPRTRFALAIVAVGPIPTGQSDKRPVGTGPT